MTLELFEDVIGGLADQAANNNEELPGGNEASEEECQKLSPLEPK